MVSDIRTHIMAGHSYFKISVESLYNRGFFAGICFMVIIFKGSALGLEAD